MPDRSTHNKIAKLFVNLDEKKIDYINKIIDSKLMLALYGPQHRKAWGHDAVSLALILSQSPHSEWGEIAKAWYIHTFLDKMPRKQQRILKALAEWIEG